MKFDILETFRDYLKEDLNSNTAEKYYFSVKKLLDKQQFNSPSEIEVNLIEEELSKIKNKNDFSAAKNGLMRLKKLYPNLEIPSEVFFKSKSIRKRNWSKKPKNIINLQKTRRKINALKNEKYKYAFRLALVSGLRVSELSKLKKDDIQIEGKKIIVDVKYGKGGSNGKVECMPDEYLAKALTSYLDTKEPEEDIFYSAESMKKKAGELGLQCHDFRRITAITFRNERKKEVGVYEANQETKEMLRHKRFSTTKRYLFNKKLEVK